MYHMHISNTLSTFLSPSLPPSPLPPPPPISKRNARRGDETGGSGGVRGLRAEHPGPFHNESDRHLLARGLPGVLRVSSPAPALVFRPRQQDLLQARL